jgi:enamine deaminase RidA (YjgF/YER057c/UK114 family)
VFGKIDQLLAEAGSDKAHVLTAQIWLASLADLEAFNAAWDAWVAPGQTPARWCAAVTLVDPAYLVEVTVAAALP